MLNEGDDFTIAVFASNFNGTIQQYKKMMNKFKKFGHLLDVINGLISFLLYLILLLFSSIDTGNSVARFFGIIINYT